MTEISDEELKELFGLKEEVRDINSRLIALEKAKKEFEERQRK